MSPAFLTSVNAPIKKLTKTGLYIPMAGMSAAALCTKLYSPTRTMFSYQLKLHVVSRIINTVQEANNWITYL